MPIDLELLWERMTRVEEKMDEVIRLLKERRRKRRRVIGFETISGDVIRQDSEGE